MQTCTKCGEANEAGATFCRNRACGAVLEWHGEPVEPDGRNRAIPPDRPRPDRPRTRPVAIGASLEPAALEVEPGDQVTCRVRVRNRGGIVDQFRVEVAGPLSPWATCEPESINVLPDQEGEIAVRFLVPRAPEPFAGSAPFEVRVTSTHDPSVHAVERGTVEVAAFEHLVSELSPATIESRREGATRLSVGNRGNAPVRLTLAAREPDERLDLRFEPATLACGPGATSTATLHVCARGRQLFGSPSRRSYTVTATREGDALETTALQEHGVFEHQPLVAWSLGAVKTVLASVVVLALLVGAAFVVSQVIDGDDVDVEMLSLVGLRVDQAEALLADVGLTLGSVSERESADTDEGRIIDQDPPAGRSVRDGTSVAITVAVPVTAGLEVPSVTGLQQDDACEAIEAAGLVCRTAILRDHREGVVIPPEGEVVRQRPAAGTSAERGSEVVISVSQGP